MRKLSMDELGRMSVADFKEAPKKPIVVVMDQIRSMHNVGSVFRTADAFLINGICLCGFTPQPPHRDIHKTALGATDSVDWLYYEQTTQAVKELKAQGYKVYAIEQTEGSIPLNKLTMSLSDDADVKFCVKRPPESFNLNFSVALYLAAILGSKVISLIEEYT